MARVSGRRTAECSITGLATNALMPERFRRRSDRAGLRLANSRRVIIGDRAISRSAGGRGSWRVEATVAPEASKDAYLFAMVLWAEKQKITLPPLAAVDPDMRSRATVQAALNQRARCAAAFARLPQTVMLHQRQNEVPH